MRLTVLLLLMWCAPVAWAEGRVTSVPELDISRYAGEWYEIARLPMPFQDECASDVTASYTLDEENVISVRNRCRTAKGQNVVAEGVARPVAGHPGRLKVRFAPGWLSWLPLVWADYWVIDLDPGYTWAVIGEPDRDYLWILSREPTMERKLFDRIRARVQAMGYDLAPLIVSAPLR
jgi:apolipoprotein D and lipocalin family protein